MEEEIDLRPYLVAVIRRWRLVVVSIVMVGIVAVLLAMILFRSHTATADILIAPVRSQVSFDSRFVTTDPFQYAAATSRQETFKSLANSLLLEQRVLPQLPPELIPETYKPGALASDVDVKVMGDLLRLSFSAADPQNANTLIEIWSRTFVQMVDELYVRDQGILEEIEREVTSAQQRYAEAQRELENFIGTSEMVQLEQRIEVMRQLLAGSRNANQSLYNEYLDQAQRLEIILGDAQTLRDQGDAGVSENLANSLATLALRARAVGNIQLPIQLQFGEPAALARSDTATLDDLDNLIATLQQRRRELIGLSQELAHAIVNRESDVSGLEPATQAEYEQQLAALQQQYEQQVARKTFLTQQRDIAFDSLQILQRKLDERRIAQGASQSEVRLIGTTVEPPRSISLLLILSMAAAVVIGGFVGVMLVLGQEFVLPALANLQTAPTGRRRIEQTEPVVVSQDTTA